MSYHSRIREIQSAFVMGYQDRETCISLFEELLHEYGLLPKEEQLDRTITNENFLSLLKRAKEHRLNAEPRTDLQKEYRIADAVKQRCPVCQNPTPGLFDRVARNQEVIPVDPPRCRECMMKWVTERFDIQRPALPPAPSLSDASPASPMSPSEADFFAEYEKQMREPQP